MTRILTKSDIANVLTMSDCVDAVEAAFLAHAKGETIAPGVLGSHVAGGGFHVKIAGMTTTSRGYYVAKVNANFPDNPLLRHLPTVQGALLLYDVPVERIESHAIGTKQSDIVVTTTPSKQAWLSLADLRKGAFVAAVGADSDTKRELASDVLTGATVVADIREQCATIGDLHHAIAEGRMTANDIHGELADVVSGSIPGRHSDDEITVFDSTGTALEDVAAAAWAYERATNVSEVDFSA